jgi:hypothetical protein
MRERLPREGHHIGASAVTHCFQTQTALLCGLLLREPGRSNPSLHPTRISLGRVASRRRTHPGCLKQSGVR